MSADSIVVTHLGFEGSFTVVGWVGSEPVLATFRSGELRCSPVLFDRAQQLPWDLALTGTDASPQADRVLGTGSIVVLFSTLLALCDRVSAADISILPSRGKAHTTRGDQPPSIVSWHPSAPLGPPPGVGVLDRGPLAFRAGGRDTSNAPQASSEVRRR